MSAEQLRRDAGRSHHGVVVGQRRREARGGGEVGRRLRDGAHVGCQLRIRLDLGRLGEVGASHLVQLHRKHIRRQPRESGGEVINRVVRDRQRAVPARVGHLEMEILIHLLAGLHFVRQVLALADVAAAAFVERELRIDQVLVVLDQPLGAVEIAAFLVRGQRQDQIAIRCEAFFLQPDQVGDEMRRHRFVVGRAAAVEEAVLLNQGERVHRPVLAFRVDDVEVREEEKRLAGAGAAEAHDQVALARIGADDLHVGGREAGGLEPGGHRVGGFRDVTGRRVGRVDLDQLFVDRSSARVVRSGLGGDDRGGEPHEQAGISHPPIIDAVRPVDAGRAAGRGAGARRATPPRGC